MEKATIIYFYPETGQTESCGRRRRLWCRQAEPREERLGCAEEFQVIGCGVAPSYDCIGNPDQSRNRVCSFFYGPRPWKPQALSGAMEAVCGRVAGMADTYLHPQIEAMLTEEYRRRWLPGKRTMQMLTQALLEQYADSTVRKGGEAAVLLGERIDTGWQMEMTRELLSPYLRYINRLLIFYEETAGTDVWMEWGNHLDEYYYEYGLVPQLVPYAQTYTAGGLPSVSGARGETGDGGDGTDAGTAGALRCGKTKCGGVILDYAAGFRYPRIGAECRTIYIDTRSECAKELPLRRKSPQVLYVSPLKYLDTMVKNRYDEET